MIDKQNTKEASVECMRLANHQLKHQLEIECLISEEYKRERDWLQQENRDLRAHRTRLLNQISMLQKLLLRGGEDED